MILSVECTDECTEVCIAKISNRCPIFPAFRLVAVTAGNITLVDYDVLRENSVCTAISCVIIAHFVRKPIQLTGVGDLVVSGLLVQRCRLIVGAVLFAEAVFVELLRLLLSVLQASSFLQ